MKRTPVRSPERWTAFLLSLVVPGAGQLYVRHWSCVVWFLAAALVSALATWLAALAPMTSVVGIVGLVLLGIASAEHAKRCLEPAGSRLNSRVECGPTGASSVRLRIEVEVPRGPGEVWRIVADFPRFVAVDPFHSRVVVDGRQAERGVGLALEHRAFGFTLWRTGRLLTWHEGHGYAFTDLSRRGIHTGFPHVFFVTVLPLASPSATCVRIDIRGKWTARWVPRWVRQAWLRYVCREHARLLRILFSQEDTWRTLPTPRTTCGQAKATGVR